jgi:SAM-dependent methyltransferase
VSDGAPRSAKLETYRAADVAATYDQRWSGRVGRRRDARKARALERALLILQQEAGERPRLLFDAPCGTGRFSALWPRLGYEALGADLSPAMLAQARAKHPSAALITADLARLPLRDRAVDAAVCVRLLHLVRSPEERLAILRELRRVSRLGAVVDWRHGHTLRVWGRRLRWRLGLRERAPANPSLAAIRAEMEAAGFRVVQLLPVHRAPFLSDKILAVALVS